MDISGAVLIAVVGLIGGLIAEALRIGGGMRDGGPAPSGNELIGSLVYVLAGLGVLFFGTGPKPAIEVAALGAAFPLLFAAAVKAAAPPPSPDRVAGGRSFLDYMATRF